MRRYAAEMLLTFFAIKGNLSQIFIAFAANQFLNKWRAE